MPFRWDAGCVLRANAVAVVVALAEKASARSMSKSRLGNVGRAEKEVSASQDCSAKSPRGTGYAAPSVLALIIPDRCDDPDPLAALAFWISSEGVVVVTSLILTPVAFLGASLTNLRNRDMVSFLSTLGGLSFAAAVASGAS